MMNIDLNKVNELADKIIKMKEIGLNTTALEQMLQQMMAAAMQQPEPEKEPEKEPKYYQVEEKDGVKFITVPKTLRNTFENGDISLVTTEEMFYEDILYYEACMVPGATTRNKVKLLLEKKAKELGGTALAKMFNQSYVAKKKEIKEKREAEEKRLAELYQERKAAEAEEKRKAGNKTKFTDMPEWCTGNKFVGEEWITNNDEGVYKLEACGKTVKRTEACGRPVAINRLLEPIDESGWDGIERVEIVFESERGWKRKVVERETLLNKNKAIALTNDGVDITSDRAGAFTGYMSSMLKESSIRGAIPSRKSSRKMALYKDKKILLPYRDPEFYFEKKSSMPNLVNALQAHGESENMEENRDAWFKEFKAIRAEKNGMFNFLTASSLCAPIIGMLGNIDGFVCNVVGVTECGKSVAESITATIWGSCKNSDGFVIGAKNTSNAFETYADVLNCLPLTIDDYNKLKEKEKEAFKQIIYEIANGIGKGRATKDMGLRAMASYSLNLIVTSEEPIRERAGGGATNRLLTYMADSKCPWTPDRITEMMNFFSTNYGHAGVEYIEILNNLGREKVQGMIKVHRDKLIEAAKGQKKTMKQINAMAVLLTADEIAADMLFEDKIKITTEQAVEMLESEDVVQTEAQAYEKIIDKIFSNKQHFQGLIECDKLTGDLWGKFVREDKYEDSVEVEEEIKTGEKDETGKEIVKKEKRTVRPTTAAMFKFKLQELTAEVGVSYEMFIEYLRREKLLYADENRDTKKVIMKRTDGKAGQIRQRMVKFRLPQQDNVPFCEDDED
jgi:putative DNA primase/helicase|uniref:Active helicase ring shaped helicase n=1 Tax=Siphoviridae sp. ctf8W5 TaxID=2825595 RepID=A0A8S5Q6I5_9CAUD|nr:MAG TPA: active helicase ring shaped helicase [Siphoviridae sp. ctf8W5]